MSATVSPSTGRPYRMRRVCRTWEAPRSTVFERRKPKGEPRKRGPKPAVPDEALIPMIREDLASSPFREEGHRKVYYRLKFEKRIKVAAKRILRLMREHAPCSRRSGRRRERPRPTTAPSARQSPTSSGARTRPWRRPWRRAPCGWSPPWSNGTPSASASTP